jgi:hypothetical protein
MTRPTLHKLLAQLEADLSALRPLAPVTAPEDLIERLSLAVRLEVLTALRLLAARGQTVTQESLWGALSGDTRQAILQVLAPRGGEAP